MKILSGFRERENHVPPPPSRDRRQGVAADAIQASTLDQLFGSFVVAQRLATHAIDVFVCKNCPSRITEIIS